MKLDQRAGSAREGLKARREHSKGDGNFPGTRPPANAAREGPQDRTPRDRRKEQKEKRPRGRTDIAARPGPSGFERAVAAANDEILERHAEPPRRRPNARRSSDAKRDAIKRTSPRGPRRPRTAIVRQAPKSSEAAAKRAAVRHEAGPGKKRTGTKAKRVRTVKGSRAGRGT